MTQPSNPPLSLAQFQAERESTAGSARGRLMAYMVLNNQGGQGAKKMMLDAGEHELRPAVNSALSRIQAKRKATR